VMHAKSAAVTPIAKSPCPKKRRIR
jgi:hypothetical protein